jgi:hypothetical protein
MNKSANVLATKERNVLSEFLLIKLDQAAPMGRLFFPHLFKNGGCSGKVLPETFGKIGVNAFVFLFQRYGERENLPFGKAVKAAHRSKRGNAANGLPYTFYLILRKYT